MSGTNEAIKPDKIRQLSIEQQNAIDHLLQGKSDRATAEAVGVSRQTVWEWRKKDILFIAELNRQRSELWSEARDRMKALANRALDVLETQLTNSDPKASLAAARYVLQGTQLLGDTSLPTGPTTPEALLMDRLRAEARQELMAKVSPNDPLKDYLVTDDDVEALAKSRLKKALEKAGLS
jgi:transposase